ncbi:MAG: protein kinase [Deltaproteobacteria bacterium]|jgi:serine/threonine protein kinase|nr:protein kinase [Deltaproteobacteria bacterium]MBW2534799.1 protein kinase [Deltaproteobacteria bacterium]
MATANTGIDAFDLAIGRVLAKKYVVQRKLGAGWEGEVYEVVEQRTGIRRAAKLYYPQRNLRDRAVRYYANKLELLRKCSMVTQYAHSETVRLRGQDVTCMLSELVEGEILSEFVRRQPGKRLRPFEALHLCYALTCGVEEIHDAGEYHGDLHEDNVLVTRRGVFFDASFVDFFPRGRPTAARFRDDVVDLAQLLFDAVGGAAHYRAQPRQIKAICRGMRRQRILGAYPTVHHLRAHLESFSWDG